MSVLGWPCHVTKSDFPTRHNDDISGEIVEPRGEQGERGVLLQHGPESDGGEDEPRDEEEDVEERERELEAGDPAAAVGAAADVHVPAAALLEKDWNFDSKYSIMALYSKKFHE